jgi:Domain of unknown function (DUF4844)
VAVIVRILKTARGREFPPMADEKLAVSTAQLSKLAEMRREPKYVDEPGTIYDGLRPESARQRAEGQLNDLIDRLCNGLLSTPAKRFVLSEFAETLTEFEPTDTEDRECLLRYLERIMDILGIESSDGLLNRWLYGDQLANLLEDARRTGPKSN